MGALVLACGKQADTQALFDAGTEIVSVPSKPGRADVDPQLKAIDGRTLVVHGTDADLAAVVVRIMRTDRLASVPVALVPVGRSQVADVWGTPSDPVAAARVALAGEVDPVPLVRDDSGGVLLGLGVLRSVRGVAYCDDATALRGRASRIEVAPDPDLGLVVRVVRIGLTGKRVTTLRGRAVQVGCLPLYPELDGTRHPRTVTKWTWYRHTEDLRVVRGLV